MPFKLGLPEIILILVIVLIIFGVGKLPQIGGAIGKSIKEFQKARNANDDKEKSSAQSIEPEQKSKS